MGPAEARPGGPAPDRGQGLLAGGDRLSGAAYVEDGEPCRKPGHDGQPTRLLHIAGPGGGYFSQCPTCREEFLGWFYTAHQPVREAAGAVAAVVVAEGTADLGRMHAQLGLGL